MQHPGDRGKAISGRLSVMKSKQKRRRTLRVPFAAFGIKRMSVGVKEEAAGILIGQCNYWSLVSCFASSLTMLFSFITIMFLTVGPESMMKHIRCLCR